MAAPMPREEPVTMATFREADVAGEEGLGWLFMTAPVCRQPRFLGSHSVHIFAMRFMHDAFRLPPLPPGVRPDRRKRQHLRRRARAEDPPADAEPAAARARGRGRRAVAAPRHTPHEPDRGGQPFAG